jgi:hypothetical protein
VTVVDTGDMVEAAYDAARCSRGVVAGATLAHGGWAVFPVPAGKKFDSGTGANSYATATIDPGIFEERARDVMDRWDCDDVNVALTPGRCATPLVVVDLDGATAVQAFWDSGLEAGEAGDAIQSWFKAKTPRKDVGRHVYFTTPSGVAYGNSHHTWGGDVRSGRGHVVVPPSRVSAGPYELLGDVLVEAPAWVLAGFKAGVVATTGNPSVNSFDAAELTDVVDRLSAWQGDAYGVKTVGYLAAELRASAQTSGRGGDGRNPTMVKAVCRALDLALEGRVNAREALDLLASEYTMALWDEKKRDPAAELTRTIQSWARRKELLVAQLEATEGNFAWARRHEEHVVRATAWDLEAESWLRWLQQARTPGELYAGAVTLKQRADELGYGVVHRGVGRRALAIGEFVGGDEGRDAVRRALLS